MRRSVLYFLFFFSLVSLAQVKSTTDLVVEKHWKVNFSDGDQLLELSRLKNNEAAPSPVMRSADVKQKIDGQRKRKLAKTKTSYQTTSEEVKPEIDSEFNGMPIGSAGIPNDNTMAISNGGFIISAINTKINFTIISI